MKNNKQPIALTIPSQGNKITANDIKNKQIRITAVFKPLFPENDSELKVTIKNDHYLRFKNKGMRSHIIKFNNLAFNELEIKADGQVRIVRIGIREFKIKSI